MLHSSFIVTMTSAFLVGFLGIARLRGNPEASIVILTEYGFPKWTIRAAGAMEVFCAAITVFFHDYLGSALLLIPLGGLVYAATFRQKERFAMSIAAIMAMYALAGHCWSGGSVQSAIFGLITGMAIYASIALLAGKQTRSDIMKKQH